MSEATDVLTDVPVDVLIIGGGIAGLWTLARLQAAGYNTVLLEADKLGAGQTRYAQGIIHGGTKYALTGKLTASSEAVAGMPSRWRDCYEGRGELDLSEANLLSDAHYLWSTTSMTSKISGFFASKVMRNRSAELDERSLPSLFQHPSFKGRVYRLDEPVFDTLSVIRALASPRIGSILPIDADSLSPDGKGALRVTSVTGSGYRFKYQKVILMAGAGNEQLLSLFGLQQPTMQRRPLRMVVMRGQLSDRVYAHCLGASVNPRITITSHYDRDGEIVWYMGGQLAEEGVDKDDEQLISETKKELRELIPWLDLSGKAFAVLDIDRAEIKKKGSKRPDSYTIEAITDGFVAWPTKLALSPALADDLLGRLEGLTPLPVTALPSWSAPDYADFPWDTAVNWSS